MLLKLYKFEIGASTFSPLSMLIRGNVYSLENLLVHQDNTLALANDLFYDTLYFQFIFNLFSFIRQLTINRYYREILDYHQCWTETVKWQMTEETRKLRWSY